MIFKAHQEIVTFNLLIKLKQALIRMPNFISEIVFQSSIYYASTTSYLLEYWIPIAADEDQKTLIIQMGTKFSSPLVSINVSAYF